MERKIDIHCHVLPGIDDGSRDADESLKMLEIMKDQGISEIFLTPHFYADITDPDTFLADRKRAFETLQEKISGRDDLPKLLLGSEVHYYRGISRSEHTDKLCMGESNYILLEPPFREWTQSFVDEVKFLGQQQGLRVIIAHIERYFDRDKKLIKDLIEDPNILIQSNAEFFIDRRSRHKALKMIKKGEIDFLGSDSHNLTDRCPNLKDAITIIEEKFGPDILAGIEKNNKRLIEEAALG